MKKITVSKLNMLLAAGIICIVAGIFLMVLYASSVWNGFPFVSTTVVLFGALLVYVSLAFTKRTLMLYVGLVSVSVGVLHLLVSTGVTSCTVKQLWPVVVILCGVMLFPAGFYRHHCVRAAYLFPAVLLVSLGVIFLLFSLSIIKISFMQFMSKWWPGLLILLGLSLVGVFLYQQHCTDQFPYIHDDSSDGDVSDGDCAE